MKITIKGTNIKLSDSVYEYIDKKINSLDRFVKNIGNDAGDGYQPTVECWVEVGKTTKHHRSGDIYRAEAQIKVPGSKSIRAESTQWDLHQAIDEVKDELQRQLKKYKNEQIAKDRRGARKAKDTTRYSESGE